ncbi:ABC-type transporter, integral membrane subunit [Methanothermococcus okinawensis IH1]|uniref:Molybdate/tungstate transport system permease protein WtpB n=2 Tax=Methanothermococcus okinawensis TaxID=155863 RepID=F8AMS3_METOI|nr:ABC-type transporter, integral membrane subunit [Methanothermococcus okinawensis IH1]
MPIKSYIHNILYIDNMFKNILNKNTANYWFISSFLIISAMIFLFVFIPIITMLLNPGDISTAIRDKEVIGAIMVSLKAAFTATLMALIFGVPLSYIFSRYEFKGKNIIEAIIDMPMAIPHSVIGIMLLTVICGTPIGELLKNYGVVLVDNFWGIVIVMLYVGIPFMINSAKNGFFMIDEELENVSRTLGASQIRTFFSISLPLIKNNLISGSILAFARGISEVGAILIMAYFPKTAPVLILDRFNEYGLNESKPIAAIMIIISILLFATLRIFQSKNKRES